MKKINIAGVLVEGANWVLHPIANYKELQEYRKDYETEIKSFNNEKEKMQVKIHVLKNQNYELEQKYAKKKSELIETEKTLHEYTSAFPGELHDYLDMQVKLEEWEQQGMLKDEEVGNMKIVIRNLKQNVYYKNKVIDELRETKKELMYQINELEKNLEDARNQVVALAKKVEFYEKQAKKTPKEKVDYLMKRSKKNENSKRDV